MRETVSARQRAFWIVQERGRKAEREFHEFMAPYYADGEFQEINKAYSQCVIENARRLANNEEADTKTENYFKKLVENYIKEHNLPAGPNYTCKKCRDTGLVGFELCDCVKKEIEKLENGRKK